jgi:hypothetical protein
VTSTSPRRGADARSPLAAAFSNTEMAMEISPTQSPPRTPRRAAKPRLFIKEMVLRNFKSYAGEQRIGPFHKVSSLSHSHTPTLVGANNLFRFRNPRSEVCNVVIHLHQPVPMET